MIAFWRSAWIWLTYRRRGRLDLFEHSRLRLRVWPGDLDLNFHMNNGRYFTIADLGRLDWGLRSNVWRSALRRGWRPMAGDSNARYSRSLQPFERYTLNSTLLGWDDKWFFCEHRYESRGRVCATVLVRYLFVSKRGKVPTRKVLELAGHDYASPALPEYLERWHQAQDLLSAELKAGS
ncbi:thioesterase [Sinimarinibacterium sp. CAU 1509]|uniref:thioesterase family protein n=1 Tax=Sinimarinibacterium sp. CAU 1509 TaxID=2562283 RepID=UPI0010AD12C7|nr:thioesterase family protein [Sinimarinibacterium sp. CAU 1509]TJY56651.1 thioesterase [Sinimarinibacterium sp. CAU 1509]